ncbi:MAG TPA: hypothetical protein VIV11_37870 [Kofleriaceae bacterium]
MTTIETIDSSLLATAIGGATGSRAPDIEAPGLRARASACGQVLRDPIGELGAAVIGHPSRELSRCFR